MVLEKEETQVSLSNFLSRFWERLWKRLWGAVQLSYIITVPLLKPQL